MNTNQEDFMVSEIKIFLFADFIQDYFNFDGRYASLPSNGLLWNINVESKIECAKTCRADKLCFSVFVDGNSCYGYSNRMHDKVNTVNGGNVNYFEKKGLLGNVALGKSASLEPMFNGPTGTYTADQAVDGRRMPNAFFPDDSCAVANYSTNAWWMVDMERNYHVTKVAILAREDNLPEQVANVAILVGNSSSGHFSTCIETTGTDGWTGRFETFTCPSPLYGRFVKLAKTVGYQYMCLCEVEVYTSL